MPPEPAGPPAPAIHLVLDHTGDPGVRPSTVDDPGQTRWWLYATEVFDHLRLPYTLSSSIDDALPVDGSSRGVLVVTRVTGVADETLDRLRTWTRSGGALVVIGDPGALADIVGVETGEPVDDAHVHFAEADIWTQAPDVALHTLGGLRLVGRAGAAVLATWPDGSAAIVEWRVGDGVAIACGADVWQSIVRIQQGDPVHQDGAPAPDGTAPLDDGLLKCEDGLTLGFDADRAMPPGHTPPDGDFDHTLPPSDVAPMFHRPHADMWRSVLLQCVWWAAEHTGAPTAWLHYWPSGVPAVAHMSHDADLNDDADAQAALDAFAEADVNVTWCQVFPGGYSAKTYAAVTAAGHEQALHYNAMGDADIARWGRPYLRAQLAWAKAVTGRERIMSNKNHYTRWEGWTQFYEWCEEFGIEIDESRGPSKQGTVGFTFGTAHVSFPIADSSQHNRYLNVLSLPLHTQDLTFAAHESIRDVILDATLDQHGVAHFLFHGVHLHRPDTRKACVGLASAARERGMEWWTAEQINIWERARRDVALRVRENHEGRGGWTVHAEATSPIRHAAVLLQLPGSGRLELTGGSGSTGPTHIATVRRHGREFVELTTDIPAGSTVWTLTRAAA